MKEFINLVVLSILAVSSSYSQCLLDEFSDGKCKKCDNSFDKGIANCEWCLFSTATNLVTCNTCFNGYFYDISSKSCKPCDNNCLTCFGGSRNSCKSCEKGKYLNTNADGSFCVVCHEACQTCSAGPVYQSEILENANCETCPNGQFKGEKNQCFFCEYDCKTCTASPIFDKKSSLSILINYGCSSCYQRKYLTLMNECKWCHETCKVCASESICQVCDNPFHFVKLPGDGTCVATCASTNQGYLSDLTTKACSSYQAPKIGTNFCPVLEFSDSELVIDGLCAPVSENAEERASEKVGAVILITTDFSSQGFPAYNFLQFRKEIEASGRENKLYNSSVILINIPGDDTSQVNLKTKVFRGKSALFYACINVHNVVGNPMRIDIFGNPVLNKVVVFSVTFNRSLSNFELNNLTCSVAAAVFEEDELKYPLLKNQENSICGINPEPQRLMESDNNFSDVYFRIEADQLNDTMASIYNDRSIRVEKSIKNFSNYFNASILVNFSSSLVDPTAAIINPTFYLKSFPKINSTYIVSITSDIPAIGYLGMSRSCCLSSINLRSTVLPNYLLAKKIVTLYPDVTLNVSFEIDSSTLYEYFIYVVVLNPAYPNNFSIVYVNVGNYNNSSWNLALKLAFLIVFTFFSL